MASIALYPPIVDSYAPAFLANEDCKIYFRFSKFNTSNSAKNAHISIVKQDTNLNVLKKISENGKYSATGIWLNVDFKQTEEDNELYYITIPNSMIGTSNATGNSTGFIPGWIYKVQVRLSNVVYDGDGLESVWINNNTPNFSEWSNVCLVKAIDKVDYKINAGDTVIVDSGDSEIGLPINKGTSGSSSTENILYLSTLQMSGKFYYKKGKDTSEVIHSYQMTLYDENDNIIENTGEILLNQYQDNMSFNYTFTKELEDEKQYSLGFKYITRNYFEDGFYKFEEIKKEGSTEVEVIDERYHFKVSQVIVAGPPCTLLSIDNHDGQIFMVDENISDHHSHNVVGTTPYIYDGPINPSPTGDGDTEHDNPPISLREATMDDLSSIEKEEDEGCIALKFYSSSGDLWNGNLCIRRTDSRSNFQHWIDIHIEVCKKELINNLPIFYDYTIESGIQYKYGVQIIDADGYRGILEQQHNVSIRNFNYSFLLGKNNQQLKLRFDNQMGSFKYQFLESKIDTIGGIYPIITRNAASKYRTFPINGLISFNMDDNGNFITRAKMYNNKLNIIDNYESYNNKYGVNPQYDFIYEKHFRDCVIDFLQDGEFKLFKSPTEGNIIVRIMEVNLTPNQSLGRMIYSFSSNAFEVDDPTMENYLKYGFYKVEDWASEFKVTETKIGQIQGKFYTKGDRPDNVFQKVLEKYGSQGKNSGGFILTVNRILAMKITFENKPMRIYNENTGSYILGYGFRLDGNPYYVMGSYSPFTIYEFDERITFKDLQNRKLTFIGSEDSPSIDNVSVTIDFLYELTSDKYVKRKVESQTTQRNFGQYSGHIRSGIDLRYEVFKKYYIEWPEEFRRLNRITSIEIEADKGSVFSIRDAADASPKRHIINYTGVLNLFEIEDIYEVTYLGKVREDGSIDSKASTDVLMSYIYVNIIGQYKKKTKTSS